MTKQRTKLLRGVLMGAGAAYAYRWIRARGGDSRATGAGTDRRYGARKGDIAGLEAASLAEGGQRRTSSRLARRFVGGALVLYGTLRRGRLGAAARALGVGLLAQRGQPTRRREPSPRAEERRGVVDIQKTFQIDVPVDQMYAFWSNSENFPLFMSESLDVEDLGSGRARWSMRGPRGTPVQWNVRITDQVPNTMVAWRNEPGALLEHAGVARFRSEGSGTRVDIRLCHRLPGSNAGPAVNKLFGPDPRATLNEGVERLKALLEGTVSA